jgi:hypothetical protein
MKMRDEEIPGGPDENRDPKDGNQPGANEHFEERVLELGQCEIATCQAGAAITYLGHGVCEGHWNELTAEEAPPDALRKALGIEVPAVLPTEEIMTIPTTGKRSGKRSKRNKAPSPEKAPKVKLKKEKAPQKTQVVFAFRLSEGERNRIHEAAGPGKATRFVRAAALAAATGDSKVFNELIAQAQVKPGK